jgi:hypothetical protein
MKLCSSALRLMRLALRDADADGWAKVSKLVYPLLSAVPDDLMERREDGDGGYVRLTERGKIALAYS